MTTDVAQDNGRRMRPGAVVAGAVLLVLGILLWLDTTGTVRIDARQWAAPMIMIAIGSAILLEGGYRSCAGTRGRPGGTGGYWLIGIGVWMLVSQTHLFGLSYRTSWPFFLIMLGLMMAIRGMR